MLIKPALLSYRSFRDGDRALNFIGRQRGLLDPAMLMIAVSTASLAPSRCPHPSARARIRGHATLNLALQSSRSTLDPQPPPGLPQKLQVQRHCDT
jgi:hypothetical protein